MHPNPIYRPEGRARDLAFASARGFGTLTVAAGDAAPMISHIPFLTVQGGTRVEAHIVRSNPIARALAGGSRAARLAVIGPDGFISPDWYGIEDQVPTWNYVAVHLTGRLSLAPADGLRDHLSRLSEHFETMLAPKPIWRLSKMTADALARLERMILPVVLEVEAIDSTWKLTQNKSEAARLGAADGLERGSPGAEVAALAAMMRDPPAGA
ncbi:MAG: transcriptional regulator [Paracoccaceae bacterium]|jgi:transcriptional regulator